MELPKIRQPVKKLLHIHKYSLMFVVYIVRWWILQTFALKDIFRSWFVVIGEYVYSTSTPITVIRCEIDKRAHRCGCNLFLTRTVSRRCGRWCPPSTSLFARIWYCRNSPLHHTPLRHAWPWRSGAWWSRVRDGVECDGVECVTEWCNGVVTWKPHRTEQIIRHIHIQNTYNTIQNIWQVDSGHV